MAKKFILIPALALAIFGYGSVSAQTATTTPTGGFTTPGAPTTGAGGTMSMTVALLVASGALALGSAVYMGRKDTSAI